ncbi:ankyrin repeat-containing domain protein [Dunaliella salina]|uniref:Ankyrin repeat-containing domain protein n=1 Tax=Dunaliella salina TaxID=3046 RepID=A0ABQ7G528_DUNSA|nr:ankyrin repeat-containing domain protein [Dunaliella salina]|eukprot:KAF5829708.1 ankyrin repeat-containing domain protein [Dunaliella salina]
MITAAEKALYNACQDGRLDDAATLIRAGADVNWANPDMDGETPLKAAAEKGRAKVVRLLLESGAAVDKADDDGWTPLLTASSNKHLEVTKLLVDKGADVNKANSKGSTPLDLAKIFGTKDIVQLLQDKAAANESTTAKRTAATSPAAPPSASVSRPRPTGQQATRTAAPPPSAPPSAPVSSARPTGQRKADVFISFRVKEAQNEAVALKRALEAENISTFCSSVDIPEGADWVRTITSALHAAQLVVVLATPTYGSPGTDSFATAEGSWPHHAPSAWAWVCKAAPPHRQEMTPAPLRASAALLQRHSWQRSAWKALPECCPHRGAA